MATRYEKAPIAEAVIDIRAAVGPGVSVESFDHLVEQLADRFPSVAPIQNFQMGVEQEAGQEAKVRTEQALVGRRLQTLDASRVLQLKLDGFTYSWLAPYDTWEAFRSEAESLWDLFRETAQQETVSRVAVRVINRINLTDDRPIPLKKYFHILPKLPDRLNGEADTFFMQLQIRMDDCTPGARAILNFAGNEPSEGSPSEIVLDFDVFIEEELRPGDKLLWEKLNGLRDCKNVLFESCITDELRSEIL
jgi:uncharacterized protein (TIGR04255 family)